MPIEHPEDIKAPLVEQKIDEILEKVSGKKDKIEQITICSDQFFCPYCQHEYLPYEAGKRPKERHCSHCKSSVFLYWIEINKGMGGLVG